MTRRGLFGTLTAFLATLPFVGRLEAQTPRFYRPERRYNGYRPQTVVKIWTWVDGSWVNQSPPSGVRPVWYYYDGRLAWCRDGVNDYHPRFSRDRVVIEAHGRFYGLPHNRAFPQVYCYGKWSDAMDYLCGGPLN